MDNDNINIYENTGNNDLQPEDERENTVNYDSQSEDVIVDKNDLHSKENIENHVWESEGETVVNSGTQPGYGNTDNNNPLFGGENPNNYYYLQCEDDKKKADNLCIISAVLMYGVGVINACFTRIFVLLSKTESEGLFSIIISGIRTVMGAVTCVLPAVGFVLMIILRVKYPKHVGGKILMWVTIAAIIITVIVAILMIIACVSCLDTCVRNCE